MDKYKLVLDIVEHPEKYQADRLREILSDQEAREIYNLLCKTASAIDTREQPDINAEWENFSHKHIVKSRRFSWLGNRAASIVAFAMTSLVAVAIGIAVTVAIIGKRPETTTMIAEGQHIEPSGTVDSEASSDKVKKSIAPVMFEDASLEEIMNVIATVYGVDVRFNNEESASLHLYYKLDPSLPLDEIISQLNTFEQISINRNGNILVID